MKALIFDVYSEYRHTLQVKCLDAGHLGLCYAIYVFSLKAYGQNA